MEDLANKKIVLFDGICNLCTGTVTFIIKRDGKDKFRFASLQSEVGKQLMEERHIDPSSNNSIIVIEPQVAYYVKSTAAIEIAKELGGLWPVLQVFSYLLPEGIRDSIYEFIAKNRYKWFGKKDSCMIPTPALKSKFLDTV
ncbi:thiol-disulfide oxidoreductase DCC family protein [Galbibacter sp.]|uniref:thiol-disulfide oxidoreductase DCC family protein n=1 Tax=Galbibacter sp. TaxID=2918471 RepID=UPI002C1171A5|nr:thiol-disulfide oxidoreductase DCC family protein [Galbibacter sp.]HLV61910.1 thiol-disulfide oxidoreductase DCC family protein [Galbibacter sp.]